MIEHYPLHLCSHDLQVVRWLCLHHVQPGSLVLRSVRNHISLLVNMHLLLVNSTVVAYLIDSDIITTENPKVRQSACG